MAIEIEKIGRVSNASVLKGTGRGWADWIRILNKAGAAHWSHKDTALYLRAKHKLTPWWQQGVTHGYEIHTGRRIDGRTLRGDYGATTTKTLAVAARNAWKTLWSETALAVWMRPLSPVILAKGAAFETEDGVFGEIRTLKKGERARLRWHDTEWEKPSVLTVVTVPKGPGKCIVLFQHDQMPDPRSRDRWRGHWKNAINAIEWASAAD